MNKQIELTSCRTYAECEAICKELKEQGIEATIKFNGDNIVDKVIGSKPGIILVDDADYSSARGILDLSKVDEYNAEEHQKEIKEKQSLWYFLKSKLDLYGVVMFVPAFTTMWFDNDFNWKWFLLFFIGNFLDLTVILAAYHYIRKWWKNRGKK